MKKSKVKLNGVKAVYHISPDVKVTTTFGRGNNSVLDKRIENSTVEELQQHSDIDVNISRKTYSFRKKSLKKDAGQFSIPDDTNDQLRIRTELEEEIFGKKFEDNIHIQAAYAVNDIIKMLAVAANLAKTAINGLDRGNAEKDMIGFYIIPYITYQRYAGDKKTEFNNFIREVRSQGTFSYFPDILPKFSEDSEEENDKEKLYYIMCIISLIRNSATHSKNSDSDTTDYIFGEFNSDNKEALTATADNLIKSKIDAINDGFSQNQKNNIYRLLKAGADTKENTARLIRRLYGYTIRKQDKNLGFSLKKLRECAIRSMEYMKCLPDKKYDTVRGKLYTLVDFVVFSYLKYHKEGKKFSENMVEQLRAAADDDDKNIVYCQGAERLYNIEIISQTIKALIKDIKSDFKQPDKKSEYYQPIIDGMKKAKNDFITTDQLSLFTKFIYVLCQFLDGKNINILLSSLISKFQQIEAFNGDIRELNLNIKDDGKIDYVGKKYSCFENSGQIANEIDMLRGVIKMDINDLNAYETMVKDALRVVGVRENEIDDIYKEYFITQDKKDSVSGFFRNNIINSRRFRYIIKYINPSDAYSIIQNEKVRNYVLNRMNDAVIDRYAYSVGIENSVHDKRKELSRILSDVNFDIFKDLKYIDKKDKERSQKAKEREKPKAILGLYLTIVYLVIKSLVRINSQYVMAIYHLERDRSMRRETAPTRRNDDISCLTKYYCDRNNHLLKEKHIVKLERYKNASPIEIYNKYRNAIAHLSAVRKGVKYIGDIQKTDSYFGIYHYCMQKLLYSAYEQPFADFVRSVFGDEKELDKLNNGSYSQAILRAMNYPFGYNPARYKNLSYEKIFMRSWQDEDTNKKT